MFLNYITLFAVGNGLFSKGARDLAEGINIHQPPFLLHSRPVCFAQLRQSADNDGVEDPSSSVATRPPRKCPGQEQSGNGTAIAQAAIGDPRLQLGQR